MNPILLAVAAASTVAAPARHVPDMTGLWMNADHSVEVRAGPCGEMLCGWVVRASPQATADARAGGVARLIGTEVLRNYRPLGNGAWQGTAFVPDMGDSFNSRLRMLDSNRLEVSGCLLGRVLCRSQVWNRP